MKKVLAMAITAVLACGCAEKKAVDNPFFEAWNTPFGVPPFDKIQNQHYMPAFEEGMKQQKAQIDSIVNNNEQPTFENTILAYDNSGELLNKVAYVFFSMTSTDIDDQMLKTETEVSKMLTEHGSDIMLNEKLFQRIKNVYDNRENSNLDAQQLRLLDKIYKGFERNGANLSAESKQLLRDMDAKLSQLSVNFGTNLRNDNGKFILVIENQEDLAGLPQSVIAAAASEAATRKMEGKWLFTLDKASMIPFLQYADKRDLREKLYNGYLERCNYGDANDNKAIIDSVVNLRLQRANLLGFPNHAAFVLDRNMSKEPGAVYALLEELWTPAVKRAQGELTEMKKIKGDNDFQSWDWWYYAEKLRASKYAIDEEQLRPYFALNNVLQGIFDLTTKLYGITYKDITAEMPLYNKENQVFEVIDNDGKHLGVVYFDFHPRASKSVGAWCGTFRDQSYKNGEKITPVVTIVCNFTKPVGDEPALLNLDEVETMFHEYGHGLHCLFQDAQYKGLSNVERDFVELPSQIMENWAFKPQVLATYAKHYKTGEVIPAELVQKIENSALFNQGFATVEYLGASLLDMDYHTVVENGTIDVPSFEAASLSKYGAMNEIAPRYRSTYFKHIFNGGYDCGYYSYIWAEVLDKDAYEAFVESGDIFNPQIAKKFREQILSKGGMYDGATLYNNFRGKPASSEPLKKGRGLI